MKPLLKSHVVYIPVSEGTYFEAGQNSFLFRGSGLFALVDRIVSLLDGTRTVANLEAIVPEKARPVLAALLGELERGRMIHMVVDAHGDPLPSHVERLYSGTIGFLKDETPDWHAVFRRWRETPIMAVGAGLSYRVLVRNLMRSGVRHLILAFDEAEDASADRAAIAASIAEAKSQDPEIVVDWVDAARAVAEAEGTGIRLLYASDAIPAGDDSLFHQLTARERPDSLLGGIYRGAALVGPQSGEGISLLAVWERIAGTLAGPPCSRAARAILGSVLAHEALKALALEDAEPARRDWLRRHCFHVLPDATVEVHKLAPAPASAPDPAPDADPGRAPDDEPLFDPLTGCLEWVEFAGAEFPLPHRAVALRPKPLEGAEPRPVTQWALTPQELDERTTARALEALAELQYPAASADGSGISPVLACRDETVWRREAGAHAIARHPAFLSQAVPARIVAESVADDDARMLIRLVRLYTGELPHLWLLGGNGASVAFAGLSGQLFRTAAAEPASAMVEALGDALSALQIRRRPDRQEPAFLGPLAAIEPDPAAPAIALGDQLGFAPPELRLVETRLHPGGAASRRWVVGRVQACA